MQEKREFQEASEMLTIKDFRSNNQDQEEDYSPREFQEQAASISPSPKMNNKKSVSFKPSEAPTTFDEIDNELRQATKEAAESSANLQRMASSKLDAAELEAKHLADMERVERLRAEIEKLAAV